eukprot:1320845-Rhodomonas_salina.3
MLLRACYAVSATDIAYAAVWSYAICGTYALAMPGPRMVLPAPSADPDLRLQLGTDGTLLPAYARATRCPVLVYGLLCDVRYWYRVCSAMSGTDVAYAMLSVLYIELCCYQTTQCAVLCGTEIGYAATRRYGHTQQKVGSTLWSCETPARCAVRTEAKLLCAVRC